MKAHLRYIFRKGDVATKKGRADEAQFHRPGIYRLREKSAEEKNRRKPKMAENAAAHT